MIVHPTQLAAGRTASEIISVAQLYQRDGAHGWVNTGFFGHMNCHAALAALQDGKLATIAPEHDDLLAAGIRLPFSGAAPAISADCEGVPLKDVPQPGRAREAQAP